MLYRMVMDIVHSTLGFFPLLGATVGHLIDGVTGATAGLVIPTAGPLIVMWLFGTREP